jgi:hypothetical protein
MHAMDNSAFMALALACAPQVDVTTAHALVAVESSHNPYAIGVVHGALLRPPRQLAEAQATARQLQRSGSIFVSARVTDGMSRSASGPSCLSMAIQRSRHEPSSERCIA